MKSDRIFLRPQYTLHYRRVAARARLESEVRADYVALFQLTGKLLFNLGANSFELKEGGAALLDPGANVDAVGRGVEYLLLTISPSFILDRAARTGMMGAGATVSFRENVVEHDRRLARFAHDLADELTEEEAGQ